MSSSPLYIAPDPRAELPLHIDSTMRTAFTECPRRFYYEFCLGFRPSDKSQDLIAGGCFAKAIEVYLSEIHSRRSTPARAHALAFAAFSHAWGDFQPKNPANPKTFERTWAAFEAYIQKWPADEDHIQPITRDTAEPSYEFTFALPLDEETTGLPFELHPSGSPFIFSGRFDALGHYLDQKLIIRDEKTTKGIGPKWNEKWDLRGQFIGYVWACQLLGLDVEQVAIRGVGILKRDIKLAEALKTYRPHLVERFAHVLQRDIFRIREAWDTGIWDFVYNDRCSQYDGCMFQQLCLRADPLPWYKDFVQTRWNPLARENEALTKKED